MGRWTDDVPQRLSAVWAGGPKHGGLDCVEVQYQASRSALSRSVFVTQCYAMVQLISIQSSIQSSTQSSIKSWTEQKEETTTTTIEFMGMDAGLPGRAKIGFDPTAMHFLFEGKRCVHFSH